MVAGKIVLIIGVTGGFATGKSTVSGYFKEFGACVFDADKIAHDILRKGLPAYRDVVSWLGGRILAKDGSIDRKRLAQIVFRRRKDLERLNRILHPRVKERLRLRSAALCRKRPDAVAVWDVPLLFESGLDREVDVTVVVNAKPSLQTARGLCRSRLTENDIKLRVKFQMPMDEKIKRADYRIDNNGTLEELKVKVRQVWKKIIRGRE
ncbi:MAG: dephospho-CoA kinase [Deltaproteobacteria bacterium]|nr:dephospho-CoA kinase [Deltaproteobacteria bacterium]